MNERWNPCCPNCLGKIETFFSEEEAGVAFLLVFSAFFRFIMDSMGAFIYRAGRPTPAAQLVVVKRNGAIQTEPANAHMSWTLIQAPLSQNEKTFVRSFNELCSGVGNDWLMRISNWSLQCIENPTAIFRLTHINTSHRHHRKGGLPNRQSFHQISFGSNPVAGFHMSIPNAEERVKVQKILKGDPTVPTQWFQESSRNLIPLLPQLRAHATATAAAVAHQTHVVAVAQAVAVAAQAAATAAAVAVAENQAQIDALLAAQPHPVATTVAPAVAPAVTQALSPFIARNLVEHARAQPDAHCPISYDSLQECTDFRVGTCGHVFSEAVAGMQTCPLCINRVAWQRVELTA